TKAVGNISGPFQKAQRRRPAQKTCHLNPVPQLIAPETASRGDNNFIYFTFIQFMCRMDSTLLVEKFKKMGAHRAGIQPGKRNGHASLRCKQTFGLDDDAGKPADKVCPGNLRMAIAPTTYYS